VAAKTLTLGEVDSDTLPATAGQARAVVCPIGALWLHVVLDAGELGVATTGSDGAVPTNVLPVQPTAGQLFSVRIPGTSRGPLKSKRTLYLTSTTNSDTAKLWAVAEDGD
jgi:hypothetical protein